MECPSVDLLESQSAHTSPFYHNYSYRHVCERLEGAGLSGQKYPQYYYWVWPLAFRLSHSVRHDVLVILGVLQQRACGSCAICIAMP